MLLLNRGVDSDSGLLYVNASIGIKTMTNVVKAESKGFDLSNLEESISAAISSVTVKDKAVFSRQFAAMFNAGVGMLRCLSVLTEQCGNVKLKRSLKAISIEVEEGVPWLRRCGNILTVSINSMSVWWQRGKSGGFLMKC